MNTQEPKMREATLSEMEDMQYSEGYAEYIMEHSKGERVICNGDMLTIDSMEDGYLFEEYAAKLALTLP